MPENLNCENGPSDETRAKERKYSGYGPMGDMAPSPLGCGSPFNLNFIAENLMDNGSIGNPNGVVSSDPSPALTLNASGSNQVEGGRSGSSGGEGSGLKREAKIGGLGLRGKRKKKRE